MLGAVVVNPFVPHPPSPYVPVPLEQPDSGSAVASSPPVPSGTPAQSVFPILFPHGVIGR